MGNGTLAVHPSHVQKIQSSDTGSWVIASIERNQLAMAGFGWCNTEAIEKYDIKLLRFKCEESCNNYINNVWDTHRISYFKIIALDLWTYPHPSSMLENLKILLV